MAVDKFNPKRNELTFDRNNLVSNRIAIDTARSLTQVWRNLTLKDGQGEVFEPAHIRILS